MYRASAAIADGTAAAVSLRLSHWSGRTFAPGAHAIDDEFSERHFTDLTGAYGLSYRPDRARSGTTFAAMAAKLAGADDELELAVVTHVTPDLDCRYAASTYLSALPSAPLSFTVHGPGAPFSAIRVAGRYQQRHGLRRVAVLAFDQSQLPYDVPAGQAATADAGFALFFGTEGSPVVLAQRGDGDLRGAVEDVLKSAGPGRSNATAFCTPQVPVEMVSDLLPGAVAESADPNGRPATAVLSLLTQHTPAWYLRLDDQTGEATACYFGDER